VEKSGNRYAMSVLAEIAKRVLGAAERAFGVNVELQFLNLMI
jgi:hypothetical protein